MDLLPRDEDIYLGPPPPDRGSRTYGGQILAQSLGAAQRTVTGDRAVHSSHSYFLKAGDAARPVELRVDRLKDGRSFGQRQVVALQDGAEVMRSMISFHVPEEGLEMEASISIDAAPPTCEQPYIDYNDFTESLLPVDNHPWSGRDRPIEVSCINPPTAPEGQPVTEPQRMWMRVRGQLGNDQALHYAGLAYLSDTGMNAVILLPHGRRWSDQQITVASLDHTIWFHRPTRADQWLYYDQRVETTSRGRGLARGRFYDLNGQLVATCMQEGLMRWKG
jgi:acyl-CoA thioesterase-2